VQSYSLIDPRLLVVDRVEARAQRIERLLREEGFSDIHHLGDPLEVADHCASVHPDLIIIDPMITGGHPFDLIESIRHFAPGWDTLPILLTCDELPPSEKRRLLGNRATDLLAGEYDSVDLAHRARHLLERRFLRAEIRGLEARLREISGGLQGAMRELQRVRGMGDVRTEQRPPGAGAGKVKRTQNPVADAAAVEAAATEAGLVQSMKVGGDATFFIRDLSGRFLTVNPDGARNWLRSPEEIRGHTADEIFPPETARAFTAFDQKVVSSGTTQTWEETVVDGAITRTHLVTAGVYRNEAGEISGTFCISSDITARRKSQEDLERARQDAERANRAKSEFISRMSHELRTPLNAILGFAQLFDEGRLNEDEKENVSEIIRAGRHLLSLINEVLDMTRIEVGQIALSLETVNLGTVVEEVFSLVKPLAGAREIRLERSPELQSAYVLADCQRLKQALLNLISNAVKYNHKSGHVSVGCEILDGPIWDLEKIANAENDVPAEVADENEHDKRRTRIWVTDTGPGIAAVNFDKIFQPFERLGMEHRGIEGTGIGLSVTKRLVEIMGGEIGFDSVLGKGTTFWIKLPTRSDPIPQMAGEEDQRLQTANSLARAVATRQKTVLYIEDNLSNLKLIERILTHRPEINLMASMQGVLGIELAQEHRPDMILLDLHLPDVNGDEVMRRLQTDPRTLGIPIVMLSADATPKQIERLIGMGARSYLTKPLNIPKFLEILTEIFGQ